MDYNMNGRRWMIETMLGAFHFKKKQTKAVKSTYPAFSSDGTTFTASEVFLDSLATFFSLTSLVMTWTFCKQAYRETNTISQAHHCYWYWIQHNINFMLLFCWIDWLESEGIGRKILRLHKNWLCIMENTPNFKEHACHTETITFLSSCCL